MVLLQSSATTDINYTRGRIYEQFSSTALGTRDNNGILIVIREDID